MSALPSLQPHPSPVTRAPAVRRAACTPFLHGCQHLCAQRHEAPSQQEWEQPLPKSAAAATPPQARCQDAGCGSVRLGVAAQAEELRAPRQQRVAGARRQPARRRRRQRGALLWRRLRRGRRRLDAAHRTPGQRGQLQRPHIAQVTPACMAARLPQGPALRCKSG